VARRTVKYNDREVQAEEIPFQIERDGDVRVRTEDGALLRLRPIVLNVLRTNERNADGDPVYVVQSVTHVALDAQPKESGK
jgi:hypothetical protein